MPRSISRASAGARPFSTARSSISGLSASITARTSFFGFAVAAALVLGALEASGSLDDRSPTWWPGLIVGPAAAALGFAAARSLFARVRGRLDAEAASMLPLYGEGAAVTAAGLSILFPPLAVLVVAALGWLLAGGRRREGEKYAGLRILR